MGKIGNGNFLCSSMEICGTSRRQILIPIGMAVVVAKEHVAQAKQLLEASGETVFEIGHIRSQNAGEAPTVVV